MSAGSKVARHYLKDEEPKLGANTAMATAQAASQFMNEAFQTLQSCDHTTVKRDSHQFTIVRGTAPRMSRVSSAPSHETMDTTEDINTESDGGPTSASASFTEQTGEERKLSTDSLSMSPLINRHLIDEPGQALKLPKLITETFPDVGQRIAVKPEHSLPSVRDIIDDLRRNDEIHPRRRRYRGISYTPNVDSDIRSPRTLPRSHTECITNQSMHVQPAPSSPRSTQRELSPVLHFQKPALANAHSAPEPVLYDPSWFTKAGEMEKSHTPTLLTASSTCSTTFLSTTSASDSLVSSSQPTTVDTTSAVETASSPVDAPMGNYHCSHTGCNAVPFQTQYLLKYVLSRAATTLQKPATNCSSSHANVHSQSRPHYCPVQGCPHSEGGKGFKRKNEMIRHGLVHQSPGYACPFCPEREHKYPRPDNLQR